MSKTLKREVWASEGFWQTNNSWIQPRTKHFLHVCRELLITHKTRIFIEIVFRTKIRNKNSLTIEANATFIQLNNKVWFARFARDERDVRVIGLERPLRYRWLVTLLHVKELYAILIGCIDFITHKTRIFIEIVFRTKIRNKNSLTIEANATFIQLNNKVWFARFARDERDVRVIGLERPLRYRWLVTLLHVKELYAILIGCIDFFQM